MDLKRLETNIEHFCRTLVLSKDEETRLRSMIQDMPEVNWTDSLGNSQLKSKMWLVDHLKKLTTPETNIVMIGGWIGLIQYLMDSRSVHYASNLNIDLDNEACRASMKLNSRTVEKFFVSNSDAYEFDYTKISNMLLINTSCEHLGEYARWIARVPKGTTCILQSNNMDNLEEHVNCKNTLQEFIDDCGLSEISFTDTIDIGDGWNRYMIIGQR